MTVLEYINSANPEKVAETYTAIYGSEDGWNKAATFNKFKTMLNQMVGEVTNMTVHVSWAHPVEDVEKYPDVDGTLPCSDKRWALDFTPWGQWKLMPVEKADDMTPDEVATFLYYEMCWHGWPEEMTAKRDELLDMVEAVCRDIDSQ